MRRGVFAMTLFLLFSTSLVNLILIHNELIEKSLNQTSEIMKAEEVFYMSKDFEISFVKSALRGYSQIETWSSHWNITYGFVSPSGDECIQASEPFSSFIRKVVRYEKNGVFLDAYGPYRSCITTTFELEGFKTRGVITSPLWINGSLFPS